VKRALLLLLALLALAGAWLWLAVPSREAREPRSAGTAEPADARESERVPLSAPAPPPSDAASEPRRTEVPVPSEAEAVEARAPLEAAAASGLSLAGRVVDDAGAPVPDFRVSAEPVEPVAKPGAEEINGWDRDMEGSFRIDGLEPGVWKLVAHSRGYADSEPLRVTLPTTRRVELVLPRGARVSGMVVDARGAPVAEAEVTLEREGVGDGRVMTDEHGVFLLSGAHAGSGTLRARGPGGTPSPPVLVKLVRGEELDGLVLRLDPGARLEGEVVGSAGEPLVGVRVQVSHAASGHLEYASSDEAGRFELVDLPAGALSVFARTPEGVHLRAQVEIAPGESAHVRLSTPEGLVHLRGRVLVGGEPWARTELVASELDETTASWSRGSTATADADGAYELTLPGSGRYRLHLYAMGASDLSWTVALDVPAVETFQHDVTPAVGLVAGRVSDASGRALAGISVRARASEDPSSSGSVRTGADGRYELVAPAGRLTVQAGGPDHGETEMPYAESRIEGLQLAEGARLHDLDLVLVQGGALEGFVRGKDGKGVARALITAEGTRAFGRTDEHGAFRMDGLEPGTLLLQAVGPRVRTPEPVRVEVVAGETRTVELVVE